MTTPEAITVMLNGRAHQMDAGSTLADLLRQQPLDAHHLATAVNGQFIPRPARAGLVLHGGDVVLGFKPVVGG